MMLPPSLVLLLSLVLGCAHTESPKPPPEQAPSPETRVPEARRAADLRRPPQTALVAASTAPVEVCEEDPRVPACRVHTTSGETVPLDLAVGHGSLALLYAELKPSQRGQQGRAGAWMHLYDRALGPIGEARLRVPGGAQDVSLVATADGWMVALHTAGDAHAVHVLALDRHGQEVGERRVIDGAAIPRLVADGARAPLLAWNSADGFMAQAQVLQGPPMPVLELFERTTEPNFDGQIAVAPGEFLVARRAARGVEVRRLNTRGELRSHHADVGRSTEYPSLALCDDGPRMIWSDFKNRGEIRWARLTADGALDGEMVRLSGVPDHFNHSPAVCDGVDTLVLLTGYTGGTGLSKTLDLVRVDGRGEIAGEPLRLHREQHGVAYEPTMLRDDDALFVAWATRGQPSPITLKRVDLAATRRAAPGR